MLKTNEIDQYNIDLLYEKVTETIISSNRDDFLILPEKTFLEQANKLQHCRWVGPDLPNVPFKKRADTYRDMSGLQFAYYLFWRTQALEGNVINADSAYFYILIYEFLAGFHGVDVESIYNNLLFIYNKFREYDKKIDVYVPTWILQYTLLNNIFSNKAEELEKCFSILKSIVIGKYLMIRGIF